MTGTWIRPAPKQLAQLAQEMRGWDYDDIRQAIIACSQAGWDDNRIYRATFQLLLREDATPGDLRLASRDPIGRRPLAVVADPGEQARATAYSQSKADVARQLLERRHGGDDPEGGEGA
jgi:hypothetical protein